VSVSVFVCYSRAQFYFAEDLALTLGQHGIDAWFDVHRLEPGDDWDSEIIEALRASDSIVLVASREALASPHVRAELDLAHELGKPLVLALAEHVDLSGALADAPRFDLRRGFEDEVRSLSAALETGSYAPPISSVPPAWSARAGVVRMVSAVLLGTALLWVAAGLGMRELGVSAGNADLTTFDAVAFALIGVFCGWLWWAFSHRRPGSATLLGVAFAYGAPIGTIAGVLMVLLLVSASRELSPGLIEGLEVPAAAIVICLVAWLGTGTWALRSASFYRWLPTGDAPRWLRRRMLARRGYRVGAQPQPAAVTITYDIHCHELDGSVERVLDRALQAAGHRRAGSASADRQIFVLSNLTPISGLTQTLAQLGARAVVVISAPVSLTPLEDVERYQWVDLRRRNRRTLERLAASIGGGPTLVSAELVPESLTRRVVPFAVLATGALCVIAAAAALATGIAGLAGADIGEFYGASHSLLRSLGALVLGALALWIATALVARRIPLRYFLAGFVGVYLATLTTPWLLTRATWAAWSALPTAVLTVVVLLVSWNTLAAWLPPRVVRANMPTLAPDNPAWWRRPAARGVVLYTSALTLLFLAIIPPQAHKGGVTRATAYANAAQAAFGYSQAAGRHSFAMSCLESELAYPGGPPYPERTCPKDDPADVLQAKTHLQTTLDEVYAHGSPASVKAAHELEATLPSSVEDVQRLRDDDLLARDSAYMAFVNLICRELNGRSCT
jgi:hypothetical protein